MTPLIISLGSWCRTAWQIRRHFDTSDAYPFDWNITSYDALSNIVGPDFDPSNQLRIEDCVVNHLGSVTDMQSGWIYHHDLPAEAVAGWPGSIAMGDGPDVREKLDQARSKAAFLHARMIDHCRSNPTIFVRWLRSGHPDSEWGSAFAGELPHELHRKLREFCRHEAVRTLYVISDTSNDPAATGSATLNRTSYGAYARLIEASVNFRQEAWTGDDAAWTALFEQVADNWLGLADAHVPA